ncbi:MAG: hypothetical protein ACYTFT_03370 [Planctomycetota bacterium]|jgi:hypothetical protein
MTDADNHPHPIDFADVIDALRSLSEGWDWLITDEAHAALRFHRLTADEGTSTVLTSKGRALCRLYQE